MKVEDKYIPIKEYYNIKHIIIKDFNDNYVYAFCYFKNDYRELGIFSPEEISEWFILDGPVALDVCQHSWVDVGFRFTKEVCSKCNKDKT